MEEIVLFPINLLFAPGGTTAEARILSSKDLASVGSGGPGCSIHPQKGQQQGVGCQARMQGMLSMMVSMMAIINLWQVKRTNSKLIKQLAEFEKFEKSKCESEDGSEVQHMQGNIQVS